MATLVNRESCSRDYLEAIPTTRSGLLLNQKARFLVTQNLDFSDPRRFAPGSHHGILLVRLPDTQQWRVNDYLVAWLSDPDAQSWARCVVVATPTKVRVIRPLVTDD
jgi:hypothetical protein